MNSTLRAILLGSALALAGCDGGSGGTGITTARGNVGSAVAGLRSRSHASGSRLARMADFLRPEGLAHARTPLEGIRVTIENTRVDARTDAAGAFALSGDFAGPIGMIFELPDSASRFRLVITVPRGGSLTLGNIRIDGRKGMVSADAQHVRFGGLVASTDCARSAATFVSRRTPQDGNEYVVDLGTAALLDPTGSPLDCASLTSGSSVEVEGDIRGDGNIEARSVEIDEDRRGNSGSGNGGAGGSGGSGGGSGGGSSTDDPGGRGSGVEGVHGGSGGGTSGRG